MQNKWMLSLFFFLIILLINIVFFTNQPSIYEGKKMSDPATTNIYGSEKASEPISTASIYALDRESISFLEEEARKGNKDAAFRLYEYYSLVILNEDMAYEWLLKSAEAGHSIAQYNLAIFLLQKDRDSEAAYWAKKARDNGVSLSDELTDLINNK